MWLCSLRSGFILAGLASVLVARAEAQEYCVTCTEPDALYRCIIEGAKPGGSQPLQMLCATTIAKDGGHAACRVKGGTVFDCNGQVKRLSWSALNEAGKQDTQDAAAARPAPPPEPETKPAVKSADQGPPQTVLEMAKRANEQNAEQWKKANDSMKEQTKKTWECFTSFFTRCGG